MGLSPANNNGINTSFNIGLEFQAGGPRLKPRASIITELRAAMPVRPGEIGGEAGLRYQRDFRTGDSSFRASLGLQTGEVPRGRPEPPDRLQLAANIDFGNGVLQAGGFSSAYTRQIDPSSRFSVSGNVGLDPRSGDLIQAWNAQYTGMTGTIPTADARLRVDQRGSEPFRGQFNGFLDRPIGGVGDAHLGVTANWNNLFEDTTFNANFRLRESNPNPVPGGNSTLQPWEWNTQLTRTPLREPAPGTVGTGLGSPAGQPDAGLRLTSTFTNPSMFNTAATRASVDWFSPAVGENSMFKANFEARDLFANPAYNFGSFGFQYLRQGNEPAAFTTENNLTNLDSFYRRIGPVDRFIDRTVDQINRPIERVEQQAERLTEQVTNQGNQVATQVTDQITRPIERTMDRIQTQINAPVERAMNRIQTQVTTPVERAVDRVQTQVTAPVERTLDRLQSRINAPVERAMTRVNNQVTNQVKKVTQPAEKAVERVTAPVSKAAGSLGPPKPAPR